MGPIRGSPPSPLAPLLPPPATPPPPPPSSYPPPPPHSLPTSVSLKYANVRNCIQNCNILHLPYLLDDTASVVSRIDPSVGTWHGLVGLPAIVDENEAAVVVRHSVTWLGRQRFVQVGLGRNATSMFRLGTWECLGSGNKGRPTSD